MSPSRRAAKAARGAPAAAVALAAAAAACSPPHALRPTGDARAPAVQPTAPRNFREMLAGEEARRRLAGAFAAAAPGAPPPPDPPPQWGHGTGGKGRGRRRRLAWDEGRRREPSEPKPRWPQAWKLWLETHPAKVARAAERAAAVEPAAAAAAARVRRLASDLRVARRGVGAEPPQLPPQPPVRTRRSDGVALRLVDRRFWRPDVMLKVQDRFGAPLDALQVREGEREHTRH